MEISNNKGFCLENLTTLSKAENSYLTVIVEPCY